MSASERRFVRSSTAASATLVVDVTRAVATEFECPAGARIVALGGGLVLAYRDADGSLPLRRVALAEGDSHVLAAAASVALQAMGGSTNAVVHRAAICGRLGQRLDVERLDALADKIPMPPGVLKDIGVTRVTLYVRGKVPTRFLDGSTEV